MQVKIEASAFAVQVMTEDLQGEISKTELERKKAETARKALIASQLAHKEVSGWVFLFFLATSSRAQDFTFRLTFICRPT